MHRESRQIARGNFTREPTAEDGLPPSLPPSSGGTTGRVRNLNFGRGGVQRLKPGLGRGVCQWEAREEAVDARNLCGGSRVCRWEAGGGLVDVRNVSGGSRGGLIWGAIQTAKLKLEQWCETVSLRI